LEVLSTSLTDDGPVYHALSAHLSRAKLITCFDDRYAVAKFFARCYASAVLAMALCPSVTSRSSTKTAERIELVFGV